MPVALETHPLDPVGVEVTNRDLRQPLSDEDVAAVRRLVVEHGWVLFRDHTMSPADHAALGLRFGPLESLRLEGDPPEQSVLRIANIDADGSILPNDETRMATLKINERWHTDSSFREVPASFSLFLAVVVPEVGGETYFAHLGRGWDDLEPASREKILPLEGVHDYASVGWPDTFHPVARRHPESGRIGLYLSEHMRTIGGLPDAEGRALLEQLIEHCTADERVYCHRWQEGDLMIWDNRIVIHRAAGFDERHPRVMHHVRIAGSEAVIPATDP